VNLIPAICGAQDWHKIALFCEEKREVSRRFRRHENGAAPANRFRRVINLLDRQAFAACLAAFVEGLTGTVKGAVAIDGKTMRARQKDGPQKALHVVTASADAASASANQLACQSTAKPKKCFVEKWHLAIHFPLTFHGIALANPCTPFQPSWFRV
jgi:DDE_Tnp_1-associated